MLLRDESDALVAAAEMQQAQVVDLDVPKSLSAAKLSVTYGLTMADSILASARSCNATLWTQDVDLRGVDGVEYVEARPGNT